MNNTKTLTAIAAILIAATLVVGGTLASTTAFAYQQKKGGSQENSKNGNTVTIEECKNRGSASGFDTAVNQECQNLICTHPGENATCTQEGTAVAPPTTKNCVECFTSILTPEQINTITHPSSGQPTSLEQLCELLEHPTRENVGLTVFVSFLSRAQISPDVQVKLISCLINAGIHFSTATSM
jgi:archaellum component FlaF (FlaF/FlaG flagellin family)